MVLCDELDVCDTVQVFARVLPPLGLTIQDLVRFQGESDTLCYNLGPLGGVADTIYNICASGSGTYASFSLDTSNYCLLIDATNAGGTDTACIVVCNMGVCDTTQYNVRVLRRGPEIAYRTVYLHQSDSYCEFTLSNLFSTVDTVYNYCAQASPENVSFNLDMKALCADYTGLSLGVDTACIAIVDDEGNRDTTLLIVSTILPVTEIITMTLNYNDRVDLCLDTS